MSGKTLIALVSAAAVFAGVFYFTGRGQEESAPRAEAVAAPAGAVPAGGAIAPSVSSTGEASPTRAADPRLAVFRLSPDNGLIEFVPGPDGKVIKEIDRNPGSPGFGKPLREYAYAGDKVVALTAYHYDGKQVQVTRTQVSYHPDGSVDKFRETTATASPD